MTKLKLIIVILLGLALVIGLTFLLIGVLKPKVAGLYIETSPSATVSINGQEVGQTPYRNTRDPGEVVIKLIPESGNTPLSSYETRVNLTTGVETVLQREFGEREETSTGEIISFEKGQKDEVSLAVVTMPDSAQLLIDGRDRAFTPHKTSSILAGEHSLVISKQGYLDRVVQIKTHVGYKLTAVVKLAKAGQESQHQPSTTPSIIPTPISGARNVEILSTPTGFLRVRAEPSTLGTEVGQVVPGEIYPLLEIDAKTGWFKIEFEESKSGFITNQYAKEVTSDNASPSATKSAGTPSPTKIPTFTPTQVP